jgi:hypothetical protein
MEVCVRTFKLNLFFCDEVLNHILVVDYICSVSALPSEHQVKWSGLQHSYIGGGLHMFCFCFAERTSGQVVRLAAYFSSDDRFCCMSVEKKSNQNVFRTNFAF